MSEAHKLWDPCEIADKFTQWKDVPSLFVTHDDYKTLRDERDRLRKVIDDIRKKSYEPDPERPELSTRAQIQLIAEAALTPAAEGTRP